MTSWDADAFRAAVATELDAFLSTQAVALGDLGEDASRLLGAARAAVRGGKRLRAAFCWWGFHAVAGPPTDAAALTRACAALELLHASALVHDDYMDASDTRRGRPATHRAFADLHREAGWTGHPEQYGAAAAILLGDLLLSWSDQLLRGCGLGAAEVSAALDVFDTTRSEVITGQFLDVSVQARGESDVEQAMRVLRFKSAKYTIERPLQVGAALAGGSAAVLQALSGFGLPLGEAFQLRDDLLGVYGDPVVTGKPAGDDLTEGKRTVLVALTLERAPSAAAQRLDAALGSPLDDRSVQDLREIIDGSGARAEVERLIDLLTESALSALAAATVDESARSALAQLAADATQRVV